MPMTAKGLAKLIEECGELIQVAGKRLAYYTTDEHPDGGAPLSQRLEQEIGDVIAACNFVVTEHHLDAGQIGNRVALKLQRFRAWHADPTNNEHGIDAAAGRARDVPGVRRGPA
jgi:NTP pyrophosphatase (non-canonical NTP hydrolase)